jgi:hypothetical protein
MNCSNVRRLLPGYLDGALPSKSRTESHAMIGQHLELCAPCREELQRYLELSSMMAGVERPVPPSDLALRIRIMASRQLSDKNWLHYLLLARRRAHLILENILEPLALPATGGLTVALLAFSFIFQVLVGGAPLRAISNDSPTNLLQPARLEALAPFPVTGLEESGHAGPHALLVAVTVSSLGDAVSYEILAGPDDMITRRQLDQLFLFSRFRPQMSFGRPTAGGHVVLSFSNVSIKG